MSGEDGEAPQAPPCPWWLPVLCGLVALAHAALWSASIPDNGGPDEYCHLDVAGYMARHGRIPVTGDEELLYSPVHRATYAPCPPLPYLTGGLAIALGEGLVGPEANPYRWARAPSLVWAAALGVFALLLGRALWPARRDLWVGFAALSCLLPQVGFCLGYFTSDGLMLAAGMVFLWALFDRERHGSALVLGLAAGLLLATRLNGFAVVVLGLGWLALNGERRMALVAGGVALLLTTPWLAHNAYRYGGDALGLQAMFLPGAFEQVRALNEATVQANFGGYWTGAFFLRWSQWTFESFLGCFGYMAYRLPRATYVVFALLVLAAGVGVLLHAADRRERSRSPFLLAAVVGLALVLQSLRHSITGDFQPQGRYLFAGLGCFTALLLCGWQRLVPERVDAPWGYWLAAALVPFAMWAWWLGIRQYP